MPQEKPLTIVKSEPLTITKSEPLPKGPPKNRQEEWLAQHDGQPAMKSMSEVAGDVADWLPTAGGAIGGILGGIGGTVAGLGVGGVPGAVGGAAVGGGAGEALRQLANRALGRQAPASMGQAAGAIAGEAALQGAAEGVGAGAVKLGAKLGERLMHSAVKPAFKAVEKDVRAAEMPRVVKTMLDEGINVTRGGIAKLNRVLNATNQEIKAAISAANGTIDPARAAARTDAVRDTFLQQVSPSSDLNIIKDVKADFLNHPLTTTPGSSLVKPQTRPLTVTEAHNLKVGEYKQLQSKAYSGELKSAEVEARKAIARGLKEDIEAEVSKQGIDIKALNQKEGNIITAKDAIARRVAAAGNRDVGGLAWITNNPVMFTAFLLDRSPVVKSMLARGLYQSAAKASGVPEHVIRLGLKSLAESKDEQEPQ